ncbi:MAG: hypothetical protein L0271_12740, partial [Gemmatimonadetes bacterium]|nr:hypothetical protein [Gemmatimonadota bacterium]
MHSRIAILLGGAASVWDDYVALCELITGDWIGLIAAVNDIGCHWPGRLDHWITLHPEKMARWRHERAVRGLPAPG